jgi:hypothetical protein
MSDKSEQRTAVDWRGWKYYCRHEPPQAGLGKLRHSILCGKTPIRDIATEDCVEGCNCIWDPSSPAYWRNYVQ